MNEKRNLERVLVELPEDNDLSHESIWAKEIGENLFELRNSPFYAYDLHFLDQVRALKNHEDQLPLVTEIIKRSGHKTLRIFFNEEIEKPEQEYYLEMITNFGTNYERATSRLLAIDVLPEADYQAVCDHLMKLENNRILVYETGMSKEV
jgi:hypothetical protein